MREQAKLNLLALAAFMVWGTVICALWMVGSNERAETVRAAIQSGLAWLWLRR